jgi:hypothetical protein
MYSCRCRVRAGFFESVLWRAFALDAAPRLSCRRGAKRVAIGGAARKPRASPALLEEIVHARLFEVSPSQAAIAASTTACSTLQEAASRASMARPFTTVA